MTRAPLPDPLHTTVRRLRDGDPRAMAQAIDVHGPAVYGFLSRMLRGDAARDDLFQDVFLALAKHAPTLDDGVNLHAWLLVVAGNRWRSYARWRLVDPTRSLVLEVPGDLRAFDGSDVPSPETSLERAQRQDAIERALAALPEHDRATLLLHLDEGLRSVDRAAALGISEPAFRKRLERARARFSTIFASLTGDAP